MLKEIYFDNSATTKPSQNVADKIQETLLKYHGNPSSLHAKGFEAETVIMCAKRHIAELFGCEPGEIYFTSGGTEANNLAIFGAAHARKRLGNKIVTTAMEHDSVLSPCRELERQGFRVTYLEPDSKGCIKIEQFLNAIDKETILVSQMMVNNEIGCRLPTEAVRAIIEKKHAPALYHIDAVQAFSKIPVKISALNADLITITAHKMHGPKGIGALFCSRNTRILPILFGGEQQNKLRPGTLATALIAGFGAAAEEAKFAPEMLKKIEKLWKRCRELLLNIDDAKINEVSYHFPYILNVSILGIRSETMLHYLSSNGIYISSGSACSNGKKSHVLEAMGLSKDRIESAIRISFSKYNTLKEVEYFVSKVKSGIRKLCKSK
jgi:cysteine desulfurase